MGLFDPAAVNRQIDSFLASVPPGKHVTLVANADLIQKKASAALMLRVSDSVGAYVRVSKTLGGPVEADAGAKISFLAGIPEEDGFSYAELVALFKARGYSWLEAHFLAFKLLRGGEVEL